MVFLKKDFEILKGDIAMILQEVTKDDFDKEVLAEKKLVWVDFWAYSCGICLGLMPKVEKLAQKYPDMKVVKMNIVGNRLFCMKQKVIGLPTYIFYKDGIEIKRFLMPEAADLSKVEVFIQANI